MAFGLIIHSLPWCSWSTLTCKAAARTAVFWQAVVHDMCMYFRAHGPKIHCIISLTLWFLYLLVRRVIGNCFLFNSTRVLRLFTRRAIGGLLMLRSELPSPCEGSVCNKAHYLSTVKWLILFVQFKSKIFFPVKESRQCCELLFRTDRLNYGFFLILTLFEYICCLQSNM